MSTGARKLPETITEESVIRGFRIRAYEPNDPLSFNELATVLDHLVQRSYSKQKFDRDLMKNIFDKVSRDTGKQPTPQSLTPYIMNAYYNLLDKIAVDREVTQRQERPKIVDITRLNAQVEECQSLLMAFGVQSIEGLRSGVPPEVSTQFRKIQTVRQAGRSPVRESMKPIPAASPPKGPFGRPLASPAYNNPASNLRRSDFDYKTQSELQAQFGIDNRSSGLSKSSDDMNNYMDQPAKPLTQNTRYTFREPSTNLYAPGESYRPREEVVYRKVEPANAASITQFLLGVTILMSAFEFAETRSWFHAPNCAVSALGIAYLLAQSNRLVRFFLQTVLLVALTASTYYFVMFRTTPYAQSPYTPVTIFTYLGKLVSYGIILAENYGKLTPQKCD